MGATAYQLFAVENLKANGWSSTPAASGAGTTLAKESRSFRVYTVALGKDRQQTSHPRCSDDRRASQWQGDVGGAGREGEGECTRSGRAQTDRSPRAVGARSLPATHITSCDWVMTRARSWRLKSASQERAGTACACQRLAVRVCADPSTFQPAGGADEASEPVKA